MPNEIISYLEMCQREGVSLQRGMNYRIRGDYSVILMSLRTNAPYQDKLEGDGTILIYEGHDAPRTISIPNPKNINQPQFTPSGTLTENGKFHLAAQEYKQGLRDPEKVKVYEKIQQESGHITVCFTSLIHGMKVMGHAKFLSLSWLR